MTRTASGKTKNTEPPPRGTAIPATISREAAAAIAMVLDHEPPRRDQMTISLEELEKARLTPKCIVENHTYADVAQIVAPGGTGKTTLLLYEAACISLGKPLWGLEVLQPGWTLFVTAEDRREQLVARLREIAIAHDFTEEEMKCVMENVLIWDVTGKGVKLTQMRHGAPTITSLANRMIEKYRDHPPAQVIFDPLVSFGASEAAVNDNEQELVTAARRIVRAMNCCVRYVHHVGKANAREKTLDQYTGRGGSALADGSRMTTVLQVWTPEERGDLNPPDNLPWEEGSSMTVYARPKLSYSPPNLPLIWIKRTEFMFDFSLEMRLSKEQESEALTKKVYRFLEQETKEGRYHTKKTLEEHSRKIGLSRSDARFALSVMEVDGRVVHSTLPDDLRQGGRQNFLCPAYLAETIR